MVCTEGELSPPADTTGDGYTSLLRRASPGESYNIATEISADYGWRRRSPPPYRLGAGSGPRCSFTQDSIRVSWDARCGHGCYSCLKGH